MNKAKNSTPYTSMWIYVFKNENGAVFLNRWDERIKQFPDYDTAIKFADANKGLVEKRIKK